jgi:hypothetical protein
VILRRVPLHCFCSSRYVFLVTFSNDELCSVILNRELAKSIYTGKKFFALNQSRHLKNINPDLDWTQPGGATVCSRPLLLTNMII